MTSEQEVNNRLHQLAKELLELTERGALKWDVAGQHSFSATRRRGSVVIQENLDTEGGSNYELKILDPSGTTIAELIAEVSEDDILGPSLAAWNATLFGLYRAARYNAFEVDRVIADLLEEFHEGLTIVRAEYGVRTARLDVAPLLTSLIREGVLEVHVSNDTMGGDPAPDVVKTLSVEYTYAGESRIVRVREGDVLILP